MGAGDEDTQRHRIRETILTAASELIAEGGAAAMTTRAVAMRAGVQAPTIYRLFEDKQGLVRAVAAHVLETYARSKDVADDDDDPLSLWGQQGERTSTSALPTRVCISS